MRDDQWNRLLATMDGQVHDPLPCGFIIDSPWLPGWYGVDIIEYLSSECVWLDANRRVLETFPDIWFLPGFWSEFGMCTEPSAFGAVSTAPLLSHFFSQTLLRCVAKVSGTTIHADACFARTPFVRTPGAESR